MSRSQITINDILSGKYHSKRATSAAWLIAAAREKGD